MPDKKPYQITPAIVTKTLTDQSFYAAVPEFMPMQNKLKAMHVDMNNGRGCKGCKGRRVRRNLFRDFCSILMSLSADGIQRFKAYLGEDKLMVNTRNAKTGGVQVKML